MNEFLALSFIILNFLDFTTTNKILALGGCEANPIVKVLMRLHLFIPFKIGLTLFLAGTILSSKSFNNGLILCGVISLFVINNYYQLYMYNKEIQE